MSTLYEYYNTDDTTEVSIFGESWNSQTFTPIVTHKITSVKLLVFRTGSPGTITVSIRSTDVDGHPTGADLCSGTTDGDTLPTISPYEWREIILGVGYNLNINIKYAIVVRAITGDLDNRCKWRVNDSSPTYTGGARESSDDGGLSWTTYATRDFMFEEWGDPLEEIQFIPLGLMKSS